MSRRLSPAEKLAHQITREWHHLGGDGRCLTRTLPPALTLVGLGNQRTVRALGAIEQVRRQPLLHRFLDLMPSRKRSVRGNRLSHLVEGTSSCSTQDHLQSAVC